MNKTIRNLAIAALFIFPGISGFPQEVQQDETPATKMGAERRKGSEMTTFPCTRRCENGNEKDAYRTSVLRSEFGIMQQQKGIQII